MVDLTTEWLGLTLSSPFVLAASPLSRDPEAVLAAVRAGAAAVVMHSLFEEELLHDQWSLYHHLEGRLDADAEARGFLPRAEMAHDVAGLYLTELRALRAKVSVPIVASLNGTSPEGFRTHAAALEEAGASAIELNLYEVVTEADLSGADVEARQLASVESVVRAVSIPVTVKLTPFYSSLPSFVRALERAGARGVSVFNRYFQPDVSLETLDVDRRLVPSTSAELPQRLHALALLAPLTRLSLGCTGGVHDGRDAAKAVLCGAHVVQLASVLLERGPGHVGKLLEGLVGFANERGYRSVNEARGVLALGSAPDPHAWERLDYMRTLDGHRPRAIGPGRRRSRSRHD